MDQESEETYDNNAASLEDNKTETDADTDKNGDAKSIPDCRLNGFVNKSFSDGGANSVDIPSIHVNDITEKHVNEVTDTQNDDVKVNMDDNKTHEEFEMGTHVTELNGKDYSHHNSLNDNNFTGQLNGSGSYTSLNDIDVPKYYSPRSRKGAQMGSENLITDNVSIINVWMSLLVFVTFSWWFVLWHIFRPNIVTNQLTLKCTVRSAWMHCKEKKKKN